MPESRASQTDTRPPPQEVSCWPDPRTTRFVLTGILILAFVLRLVYVLQMQANPYFSEPAMDALYHVEWAKTFAAGETFEPGRPFFRGPLYPWFLGSVFRVFGEGLLVPRVLQAGFGTATVGLCYLLGRDVFDRRTGLLAALLAAVYWVMIYFDGELLITSFVVPINLLALWMTLRLRNTPTRGAAILAGLCWGVSALARPQVLLLMPFLALWLLFRVCPNWRSGLVPTLALALGTALPIAPITAINISEGDSVLIASGGGVNFWIGNNPKSDGSTAIVPGTRPGWWQGYRDAIAQAETAEGRKLKASEVSSHYVGRTWDHFKNAPGQAAAHLFWKFRLFWTNWELGNNQPIYYFAHEFGSIVNFLPLGFWAIAPIGILGILICLRRRSPDTFPLWAFVFVQMATIVAFFVCSRFRLPIIPVLMVFGAHAIFQIVGMVRNRSRVALGWSIVVMVLVSLFVILVPARVDRSASSAMRQLGVFAQEKGKYEEALSFYRRALAYDDAPPRMKAVLHKDLGTTLTQLNRLKAAERELKFALEYDPRQSEALSALTTLYLDHLKKPRQALTVALAMTERQPSYGPGFYNLGQCHIALEQVEKARVAFESGLRIGGVEFECALVLGQIQINRKQWKTAEGFLRRALASRKEMDSWYFTAAEYLVKTLLNSGNRAAAEQFAKDLVGRAPRHPQAMRLHRLAKGQ
ncbi:MAG: glycosyltransferase family 39 protein [Planctomycetota bacterium]|nr:glycosyltransferase family 39 protein [Planctomycetota bacterium]